MRTSTNNIFDKLIWLLTVFLLTTFLVFSGYSWGRYAFVAVAVLVVFLTALMSSGKIWFRIGAFHWFMLAFGVFALLSSVWAMNASDAISKGFTIFQIFFCGAVLYIHYEKHNDIQSLLSAVMWSGYFVALYTISFFGLDYLMEAAESFRMESQYANSNSIGMAVALSCVIQSYFFVYKKNRWSAVFMIPAVVVVAASQSRKALLFVAIGVVGVYIVRNLQSKGFLKKLITLTLTFALLGTIFYFLYQMQIFDGIRYRINTMLASFTGEGTVDNSTVVRNEMVSLGWQWFLKYPLLGIGIGNPHILAGRYLALDTYLHNNYVEMLCGGGIIGFGIYYGMYIYLLVKLLKYGKADKASAAISIVWLGLMLIMDYGMVSYYSKSQWIYLMVHFLNVYHLERKYKEQRYANKQTL